MAFFRNHIRAVILNAYIQCSRKELLNCSAISFFSYDIGCWKITKMKQKFEATGMWFYVKYAENTMDGISEERAVLMEI